MEQTYNKLIEYGYKRDDGTLIFPIFEKNIVKISQYSFVRAKLAMHGTMFILFYYNGFYQEYVFTSELIRSNAFKHTLCEQMKYFKKKYNENKTQLTTY